MKLSPDLVAINHDDYHAKYVGKTADGRQFFWTTPFVPCEREFDALYLFDANGNLLEARIDDLGTRGQLMAKHEEVRAWAQQKFAALGEVHFKRIEIAPFQIEQFGVIFGLVLHSPEEFLEGDEDEEEREEILNSGWQVTVEPGDYMAFREPFDSGDYDT